MNVRAGGVCEPQPHPFGAPPRQVDAWPACSPTTRAGPLVKLQDPLRRSAGSCGERTWATGMRAGMAIDKAAAGARAASSSVLASIGKARKVVSSRGLATTTFYFSVNNYVYTGGGKPLLVSPASAGLGRGGLAECRRKQVQPSHRYAYLVPPCLLACASSWGCRISRRRARRQSCTRGRRWPRSRTPTSPCSAKSQTSKPSRSRLARSV